MTILDAVWQVLTAIGPSIVSALSRGVSAESLTSAMIGAASSGAHARVKARTGKGEHPLASIALRLDDLAALCVAENQPVIAGKLRSEAVELRTRSALLPTP